MKQDWSDSSCMFNITVGNILSLKCLGKILHVLGYHKLASAFCFEGKLSLNHNNPSTYIKAGRALLNLL